MQEMITCITKKEFDENFSGFIGFNSISESEDLLGYLDKKSRYYFLYPKEVAEKTESLVQIVSYTLVVLGDKVVCYNRDKSVKELCGLLSIGYGGHLNSDDIVFSGMSGDMIYSIKNCATRELSEELEFPIMFTRKNINICGAVRTEQTEICRKHLGFVSIIDAPEERLDIIKDSGGIYIDPVALKSNLYDSLEPWSKVVLDAFLEGSIVRTR